MRLKISTSFDCRRTGVVGHYRLGSAKFIDQAGQAVIDRSSWDRSRNQQRNLETLVQLLGMRTQLINVTAPEQNPETQLWEFVVEPDRADTFADGFAGLKNDCEGVPMLLNLGEAAGTANRLVTQGADANIWFQII